MRCVCDAALHFIAEQRKINRILSVSASEHLKSLALVDRVTVAVIICRNVRPNSPLSAGQKLEPAHPRHVVSERMRMSDSSTAVACVERRGGGDGRNANSIAKRPARICQAGGTGQPECAEQGTPKPGSLVDPTRIEGSRRSPEMAFGDRAIQQNRAAERSENSVNELAGLVSTYIGPAMLLDDDIVTSAKGRARYLHRQDFVV